MSTAQQAWPASRIVHLAGGCRAININNPGPTVDLLPLATNRKQVRLTIPHYGALFNSLQALGLFVVGVDFYSHALEAKGKMPPNWRPYDASNTTVWLWDETDMKWSHIGHAAHKRKNGRLWDLASRISHQTRVCSWRLRQISEAYREQLFATSSETDFQQGRRFEDGFTWLGYLSIQAFLVDACILRDYFAEFSARFVYAPYSKEGLNVTSMAGLKKHILSKTVATDAATQSLKEATGEDGWLKQLGEYRDLVVHSAPLAKAERKLWAIHEITELGDSGGFLPAVKFPIPENPSSISRVRANGDLFRDFTRQFETFAKASAGESPNRDGLAYAHDVMRRLAGLSALLVEKSPVAPEMMVFDKTNIIGEVRVTNAKV